MKRLVQLVGLAIGLGAACAARGQLPVALGPETEQVRLEPHVALLRTRRALTGNFSTKDTFAMYNLFGDPALRIAGNTAGHPADANFAQWRWQRHTPVELADPETGGATEADFFEYAMGGEQVLRAELPEFGYALPTGRLDGGGGGSFILRWRRRVRRDDVDYRLWISGNLREWIAESAEAATIGVEPDPDGVMDTVRTRIDWPENRRIFVGVKAVRK